MNKKLTAKVKNSIDFVVSVYKGKIVAQGTKSTKPMVEIGHNYMFPFIELSLNHLFTKFFSSPLVNQLQEFIFVLFLNAEGINA